MNLYETDGQTSLFSQDTEYGKTCRAPSVPVSRQARTSVSSSKNSFESWIAPWLFLDLRPGHGSLLGALWEPGFPSLLGFSTLATTAWPKDAKESFLSAILEVNPHPKYYLTPTACRGILRRAKKRGKELPAVLEAALRRQAEIPMEVLIQWREIADKAGGNTALTEDGCLTPWDVQSKRIFDESGIWPTLYSGDGGGHGYVSTAFSCNQRDEVRDLNNVAAAVCAQPGMKQQTFVTIPINTQIATRHESLGEGTGLGIGNDGDPAFTLQAAHSHAVFSSEQNCLNAWDTQQSRIFTEDGIAPTLAGSDGGGGRSPAGLVFASGVVTKGNGDCFLTEEQHTSLTSGGGQAGQGYPCVLTAAFSPNPSAEAGSLGYEKECSPTLTSNAPAVICLNDQGGQCMSVYENQSGTLRAQMGGHPPLVMATQQGGAEICEDLCPTITSAAGTSGNNTPVLLFENHGIDSRYTGPHEICPTIAARAGCGGNNLPILTVPQPRAFSLDSAESNSMKSKNVHSGCREVDTARTIDTTVPCPSKNQVGLAILQETYAIAGNIVGRKDENGGNGFGYQPDVSYTLTETDVHCVFAQQGCSQYTESPVASTQTARQYKDATDLVCDDVRVFGQHDYDNYKEGISTLCASGGKNGGGSENLVASVPLNLVRRLTPLECERLQGFPSGWTNIHGASDSARYKSLGNSVAIPCVEYIMMGIAAIYAKESEAI